MGTRQKTPINEQVGQHSYRAGTQIRRASLSEEELYARQMQSPGRSVGTYSGTHPEDAPYTTSGQQRHPVQALTLDDIEEDERFYASPSIRSARKYNQPVVRTPYPPPVPTTKVTEDLPGAGISFRRFLFACLGVLIASLLLSILLVTFAIPAIKKWSDDNQYGYPRIIKVTANVGHGEARHPFSQFIGINNNGIIDVVELSYGNQDQKSSHVYYIATLTGSNADLVPISSLSFLDMNGDGKPDMEVVVNSTLYVLYNDGGEFKPRL